MPKGFVQFGFQFSPWSVLLDRQIVISDDHRYEIMYGLVRKAIRENYPDLDPETMQFVFPHWGVAPKAAP